MSQHLLLVLPKGEQELTKEQRDDLSRYYSASSLDIFVEVESAAKHAVVHGFNPHFCSIWFGKMEAPKMTPAEREAVDRAVRQAIQRASSPVPDKAEEMASKAMDNLAKAIAEAAPKKIVIDRMLTRDEVGILYLRAAAEIIRQDAKIDLVMLLDYPLSYLKQEVDLAADDTSDSPGEHQGALRAGRCVDDAKHKLLSRMMDPIAIGDDRHE